MVGKIACIAIGVYAGILIKQRYRVPQLVTPGDVVNRVKEFENNCRCEHVLPQGPADGHWEDYQPRRHRGYRHGDAQEHQSMWGRWGHRRGDAQEHQNMWERWERFKEFEKQCRKEQSERPSQDPKTTPEPADNMS